MTQPPHPADRPVPPFPPPGGPAGAPPPAGWSPPAQPGPWSPAPQPGPWPQQPPRPGQPHPGGAWPGQPQPQQPHPGGTWPHQPQPPGAWPGTPSFPASRTPVVTRIPEDQPFVVRHNVTRRALVFGALLLLITLLTACPLGLAAADGGSGALLLLAVPAVFGGLVLGLQLWLLVSGGPVLAVGPAGLWIKTRPTRGQAIWLPWEAIERIYPRRWSLEKMVCVKPRDPRTGGDLGAFTALDAGLQKLFFGTGFTATLNFADRPEQEIMGAIAHYAARRCRIG